MNLKQVFGIAAIINITFAFANPVRAEWITGSGLVSTSMKRLRMDRSNIITLLKVKVKILLVK
jgi:hypothetical protein